MIKMEWINVIKVEDITKNILKVCIKGRSNQKLNVQDLTKADEEMKNVKMSSKISRVKALVGGYSVNISKCLNNVYMRF